MHDRMVRADVSHMLKMLFGIYLDFAINDAAPSLNLLDHCLREQPKI